MEHALSTFEVQRKRLFGVRIMQRHVVTRRHLRLQTPSVESTCVGLMSPRLRGTSLRAWGSSEEASRGSLEALLRS